MTPHQRIIIHEGLSAIYRYIYVYRFINNCKLINFLIVIIPKDLVKTNAFANIVNFVNINTNLPCFQPLGNTFREKCNTFKRIRCIESTIITSRCNIL